MIIRKLFFSSALLFALFSAIPAPAVTSGDGPALTARDTGVGLYAQQDPESPRIATLERGERLVPLIEAVGSEIWYMVRTKDGATGWVRGADVITSTEIKDVFTEKASAVSTWSARTADGRVFQGTWTLSPNATKREASGGWTLTNSDGATLMRGSWLAEKHETGWNGVWRAAIEGRAGEQSGSWSADFPHVRDAPFAELFAAAAKEAIKGLWTGGAVSGSWSMRYAK